MAATAPARGGRNHTRLPLSAPLLGFNPLSRKRKETAGHRARGGGGWVHAGGDESASTSTSGLDMRGSSSGAGQGLARRTRGTERESEAGSGGAQQAGHARMPDRCRTIDPGDG